MRLVLLAAAAAMAAADSCTWTRSDAICPAAGQVCTADTLCAAGTFCRARSESTTSYTGTCDVGPDIMSVYGKTCVLGNDVPDCVFNDPLRMTPKQAPSALQCVRAHETDSDGTCRIGPNKHGDACNLDQECASGNCQRQLRLCAGIDEGEVCTPGYPDPCGAGHYCAPTAGAGAATCQKKVSAGKTCKYTAACERGFFCAGPDTTDRKCVAPFSLPVGANTTIGPYMCSTGNALLVKQRENPADSTYMCADVAEARIGEPCDASRPAPVGYECKCSSNGSVNRLISKGMLGLGARTGIWKELFSCLNAATGVMGDLCEFDSLDLERVRYGSCGYYQCYPQYLKLVNGTGGRFFNPEFAQFIPYASCETEAAQRYYDSVLATPCLTLPSLENWKCASLLGPTSLSVAGTNAILTLILMSVIGGFCFHAYHFRIKNRTYAYPGPWAAWWNQGMPPQ